MLIIYAVCQNQGCWSPNILGLRTPTPISRKSLLTAVISLDM